MTATAKEIVNDFKENYIKIRKLIDEDSKHDPETEPYLSKYKAKDILLNMWESLKNAMEAQPDCGVELHAMLGTVLLNLGIVHMETEEPTASEKCFTEAVELLIPNSIKPEVVIILINIYNNLGILWSNRDEPVKAKSFLISAKELYESFKCTMMMPLPIMHVIGMGGETDAGDFMMLEKAHTLTLYYLAQVYGTLKENLKSAVYCHVTLRKQLQYCDYEPIDWALNCATLSQFFAEQEGFYQSRHHLAAASTILEKYEEKLMMSESDDEVFLAKVETLKHRSADVARCWIKYCLLLMTSSKARLMTDAEKLSAAITDMANLTFEDNENICAGNFKNLVFTDVDVSKYENMIVDTFLLTFEDARKVFLNCQNWINKAKEYYKLDTLASDHIELVQDNSQAYCYLAFFEGDDRRKTIMYKRRADMLEEVVKEINPTYYLQYCRQLWFELGEIYTEMLNIQLDKHQKRKGKPVLNTLKKINILSEKSMENYEFFIDTIKDKYGSIPTTIDPDLLRPVITSFVYIGRNSTKRITLDKTSQLYSLKKSYEAYRSVIEICAADPKAAVVMQEEERLCKEMMDILPFKLKRLESEVPK